ncbi:Dolichyl-diphosphooligosaccharide--protein glycosyltransferase subunit STT3B [Porphyridium purpureum]|uniref:dolichyl-diphosphooligosaccharide--protein glycotransferase n=1 Tax=Porphyridium purpureum TaxID=35688 RepID=A0A5J4YXR7_PORPP|nr:Dolichyl-diphosphooligosaccharide--protein glycosyltransferase subunit STT3B [Porphyridium purpureum]|eukprot:POR7081..scf208_2
MPPSHSIFDCCLALLPTTREQSAKERETRRVGSWDRSEGDKMHVHVPGVGYVRGLSQRQLAVILRVCTLGTIWAVAFCIRMFSVLRYESIIHEFDPWFNYRATKVLVDDGTYAFWNWFDASSWYPLGRIVGGTVYPGIMYTAALLHRAYRVIGIDLDIREVCVTLAPVFSGITALATYMLTQQTWNEAAGLLAAAFVGIVPGYIARSAAGSYDNEAVAITALILTFALFVKAVNTGSIAWAALASLSYLYMVSSWGGYIFVMNVIPIYVLTLLLMGRYTNRLYVSFCAFYVLGTLLSMQIRFVGFNAVQSSEHMGALGVFGILNLYCCAMWIQSFSSPQTFRAVLRLLLMGALSLAGIAAVYGIYSGYIGPWTGRFYTLLDPTYAKRKIPIIASVAEHQPTSWSAFFFENHFLVMLMPVGIYHVLRNPNDTNVILVVYGVFSTYFTGVMNRLMLVYTPMCCVLAAIAISELLSVWMVPLKQKGVIPSVRSLFRSDVSSEDAASTSAAGSTSRKTAKRMSKRDASSSTAVQQHGTAPVTDQVEVSLGLILVVFGMGIAFVHHCVWSSSEMHSSPSVVLSYKVRSGDRVFIDDFREAYQWLNQNTASSTRVLSWWDYGYQLAGMSNVTTIVDNNTWNNTHIGTVGRCLNSDEVVAHRIARKLDVDYVLVVFGGLIGYASDDLNKLIWPIRISGSVDPSVNERDYLTANGEYSIGDDASETLTNSLMFRLSYHRFADVVAPSVESPIRDQNRGTVSKKARDIRLHSFEEVFTTGHWLVRIYRVKPPHARGFPLLAPVAET